MRSLLAKAEREFPSRSESERQGRCESYQRGVGSHAALQFKGAALEQGKFALGGIGAAAINVVNHAERYPLVTFNAGE